MTLQRDAFPEVVHEVDVCVVGGGMAGLCAAIAAARHGASVALMHDRPVLGGNASSETRVCVSGADRSGRIPNMRETGILEELRLENVRRNPNKSYSVWDMILYEKVRFEPNITLLLNCSCLDAETDGKHIASVTGWQLTTETFHKVTAALYADCSGDGILAPLTGAAFRMGREARDEHGESIAPRKADSHTMGMTCLFVAREYDGPQSFDPPSWAHRFESDDELPYGAKGHRWCEMGYWWIELGGEQHGIHDTEAIRDELLKITLGVWDHIKNRGDHGADNWALDWIQFLPGKRESRRYVGDHVLTQLDVESEGKFDDVVAYGGWPMDDHHWAGFRAVKLGHPALVFYPAPSPYGIPYRALYSKDVDNLMFAGRCASCTHAAMSSTRVMGTACSMGQAVGTAAAMAAELNVSPRRINGHMKTLQQLLLADDCYLPWVVQEFGPLTTNAKLLASQGDPEPIRDGVNRPVDTDQRCWKSAEHFPQGQRGPSVRSNLHCWTCNVGDSVAYLYGRGRHVQKICLVLDSALDKDFSMRYSNQPASHIYRVPDVMPREFHIDGLIDGEWTTLHRVEDNYQRVVQLPIEKRVKGIRFALDKTWASAQTRLYAFYVV